MLIEKNLLAKLVVMDEQSSEEYEEGQVLLKILVLGSREIEKGRFTLAEDVFSQLDSDEMH